MYSETLNDALVRLDRDFQFKRKSATHLRGGICPSCHKKELWTHAQAPWVLFCPRTNHCGEQFYLRDLYPDLFENWEKRFKPSQENPTATVDAYLCEGRGFPLDKLKGLYTQEYYKNSELNVGSVTIRFPITDEAGNEGWWQRILDDKGVLQKTTFKWQWSSSGHAWLTPNTNYLDSKEIWITEGIFDTIALWLSGITSFSALSSNNYPSIFLEQIVTKCRAANKTLPTLVWAFDADPSGKAGIEKNIRKATEAGFTCVAAQPPAGRTKTDWNDLYKAGKLGFHDLENYRYYGDLLTAQKPVEKALLIYKRHGNNSFPFDFMNQLYWFKLDMDKYNDALKLADLDNEDWLEAEKEEAELEARDNALKNSNTVTKIVNCKPTALYYQYSDETDEAWYFFNIDFPRNAPAVQNTFTGSQLAAASEFKKRLLAIAPGVVYTGSGGQLDKLLEHWITDIKRVQLINYVGYHNELKTYVLGDIAYQNGKQFKINNEQYFELPRKINLKSRAPFQLSINTQLADYKKAWVNDFIGAFQVKGLLALTAFFGSLYAQQIRHMHKSFPFVEIVGEPGTGKTTLIQFLWKLFGRANYEGLDPNKTSKAGLTRTFRQVSNLPVLLIESDRQGENASRQFNWDTIKTLYDGGSLGAQGVKNGGNETYEPPFMGTVIISQNAEVLASEAVMGRIVHVGFKKDQLTKETLVASRRLSKYELEDVSQFILECLQKEKEVLHTYSLQLNHYDSQLHQESLNIQSSRVVHNHAQLMALFDAMCQHLITVPAEIQDQVRGELVNMAISRDKVLKSDSVIVQNFWDTFEQIEGHKSLTEESVVNHHSKSTLIAINFPQLYKVASDLHYQLPPMQELQDALRHSQHYRFIETNRMVSSRITRKSTRCWIFEKPVANRD
ncbi:toprim domain-containing protein [Alkanindiges illinoisensis]|uniref:Toprim domain-containing protein n=1 Tax=Alkanindiges illinoisensis TaxID=197183 RepID=A0A4Y7X8R9_9GAMM|nr:toprim domain-containing protein [Alkanindiges illinoisensis]TEU23337.1 toprim domain-containing protein [Alkanindiges illinoisensis]